MQISGTRKKTIADVENNDYEQEQESVSIAAGARNKVYMLIPVRNAFGK